MVLGNLLKYFFFYWENTQQFADQDLKCECVACACQSCQESRKPWQRRPHINKLFVNLWLSYRKMMGKQLYAGKAGTDTNALEQGLMIVTERKVHSILFIKMIIGFQKIGSTTS